ncbi:MAG TPA: Ig-like domain-containing protein [Urbifossiella sp.]|nr:Ig-like domain-containing protein [Urbifossiella sp.]
MQVIDGKTGDPIPGSSGGVWVHRSGGDTTASLSVNLSIGADGAGDPLAAWGDDYDLTASGGSGGSAALSSGGGSVTFGANDTAVYLGVDAAADGLTEGTEGFRVTVGAGTGYTPGSGGSGGSTTADVQILDTSTASGGSGGSGGTPAAVVWVGPPSQQVAEGSSGGVWVYRSGGDATQPLTINLSIGADGADDPLATWATDYTVDGPPSGLPLGASGGTVTFGPNVTSVFLAISALNDDVAEGTEGFRLTVLPDSTNDPATYQVEAPGGSGGATADVVIPDVPPIVAVDDTATTPDETPVVIAVLGNDSDPLGHTLAVSDWTDPANGFVELNADGTLTYTPDIGYTGTDGFSYTVSDGQGRSASADVSINVQSRLLAPLTDQASAEGAVVSVAVPRDSLASGLTLSFSASGLPAGLSIDPDTGVISGQPLYSDAQTNSGVYAVTVTATAGSRTDGIAFTWSITDTNRLARIDDYLTRTDPLGNFTVLSGGPIQATDELGDALSFSISGVPVTIAGSQNPDQPDQWTATLGGQLSAVTADYTVTVSVTGGGATDSRAFHWHNDNTADETIVPMVADTVTTADDYSFVGTAVDVGYLITGGGVNP